MWQKLTPSHMLCCPFVIEYVVAVCITKLIAYYSRIWKLMISSRHVTIWILKSKTTKRFSTNFVTKNLHTVSCNTMWWSRIMYVSHSISIDSEHEYLDLTCKGWGVLFYRFYLLTTWIFFSLSTMWTNWDLLKSA